MVEEVIEAAVGEAAEEGEEGAEDDADSVILLLKLYWDGMVQNPRLTASSPKHKNHICDWKLYCIETNKYPH
jgi:hypothetical protein